MNEVTFFLAALAISSAFFVVAGTLAEIWQRWLFAKEQRRIAQRVAIRNANPIKDGWRPRDWKEESAWE